MIDTLFFVQPKYVEDDDYNDLYSRKEHNLPPFVSIVLVNLFSILIYVASLY